MFGILPGLVSLHIDDHLVPKTVPPRHLTIAFSEEVNIELAKLVQRGLIENIDEPADWVSQIIVVKNTDVGLRICINPQPLNMALLRERYLFLVV